ncbi:MAG: glutamate-1-semialdehyde 2,1-aminomutase [Lachnospiraceae bacterium]|nr:glutamate-1-semialdehyde 2,1-aminomutase [Lachnospiraceae bacterium]MDD3796478.1 glutamate-1-semialdehyde 2,1-aminomutase [Lachnospiraceae bacterium]
MTKSEELFKRAVRCIPGGVNSPVRAFGAVGETPRFIVSAKGDRILDADGNSYLDFIGSWGPMILGHNHPKVLESVVRAAGSGLSFGAATEMEVIMAELICDIVPSIEMVRMVNSGTEAVMSAVRTARGYTGRNKIVKFMGCYHGHSDAMLVKAGSGVMTQGIPDSAGVPAGCTEDTLSAVYNDLDSVETLFEGNPDQIAAVIVEPVGANMGVVPPAKGFLEGLRDLCTRYGALLIFDEVITGFRLALDGAQGYFGVRPDLTTFGKIIGGGMPVGAYGGKREVMSMVAPVGPVYQAGTLSGNPVAMAAGITQLSILKENPDIYRKLNENGDWFYSEIAGILKEGNRECQVNHIGSLGCVFFTKEPVVNYASAKTSDVKEYRNYFKFMLEHGIYLAPAQFEAMFLSAAHTRADLEEALDAVRAYVREK